MPTQKYKNLNNMTRDNFTPIKDFLASMDFAKNRLWRISGGKIYTFVDGQQMSEKEFRAKHPIKNPVSFNSAPFNADHTKDFLR
jgi:hypothetical protein